MSVGMSGYSGVGATHMTGQVLRFRHGVISPPPEWTTPPPVTSTLAPFGIGSTPADPLTKASPRAGAVRRAARRRPRPAANR